jgi:hypothetical protein
LSRVIIVIERETYLIRGLFSTHHGQVDIIDCINYQNYAVGLCPVFSPGNYYMGMPPFIYSAAGTHAIYSDEQAAYDDGFNGCNPGVSYQVSYYPGQPSSFYSSEVERPELCLNEVQYNGVYLLIDVFNEQVGL